MSRSACIASIVAALLGGCQNKATKTAYSHNELGSLIANISELKSSSASPDWLDSNWSSYSCPHGDFVYWQKGSGGDSSLVNRAISVAFLEDACRIDTKDNRQVMDLFVRHAGLLGNEGRGYFGAWIINRIIIDSCGACPSVCINKVMLPSTRQLFHGADACHEDWCQIISKTELELQQNGWRYPRWLFDSLKKQLAPSLLLEPVCDTGRRSLDAIMKNAPKR